MPEGRIRAMAVGVRSAMAVDWIALTTGIAGVGVAMISLMIMLDRDETVDLVAPLATDICGAIGPVETGQIALQVFARADFNSTPVTGHWQLGDAAQAQVMIISDVDDALGGADQGQVLAQDFADHGAGAPVVLIERYVTPNGTAIAGLAIGDIDGAAFFTLPEGGAGFADQAALQPVPYSGLSICDPR